MTQCCPCSTRQFTSSRMTVPSRSMRRPLVHGQNEFSAVFQITAPRISVHNGCKSSSASAIFLMASLPPIFIARFSQCARKVELLHLAGVARKIVGNDRFAGKFFRRRQQRLPGLRQTAVRNAAQGIGAVQPAGGIVGRDGQFRLRNFQRLVPAFFMRTNRPARFQHVGMVLLRRRN